MKLLLVKIADLAFYIYHKEQPNEPPHVHVFKGSPHAPEAEAKVRIDGIAHVFYSRGFNVQARGLIAKITQGYIEHFSSEWRKIHGQNEEED